MKQYTMDQLREEDYARILAFLEKNAEKSAFGDIFWLEMPEDFYSEVQAEHAETCSPYYFAVCLDQTRVEFEFLVRSRQKLRCACVGYADRRQREYIMSFADTMLERLGIKL